MDKKRILKILILIIAIIVILFVIYMVRNFVIIDSMQKKVAEYDSTNFYRKTIAKEKDKTVITEYYRKDNKQVVFMEKNENGKISKVVIYDMGYKANVYEEIDGEKIAKLHYGEIDLSNIVNGLETDNKWQVFIQGKSVKVKSDKINDKKCYAVSNFVSLTSPDFENRTLYIDKESGLLLKNVNKDSVIEYEYDIGNVKDEIFIEPDISQYKTLEFE